MNPTDSVEKLNGVGPSNAKKLAKLGIFVVDDLLRHFPFRYDDLSKITPLAQVSAGGTFAIKAKIVKKRLKPGFGRRVKILEALLQDESASIVAVWFNQPYLNEILKEGQTYLFAGPAVFYKSLQMQNPAWELDKPRTLHIGRIVPVYPLTGGIYPKWLRSLIKQALEKIGRLPEFLPDEIITAQKLLPFGQAVRSIHFPENPKQLAEARRRLSFDELFLHELKIIQHKNSLRKSRAVPLPFQEELAKTFVAGLPFELTRSQKIAAWQIMQDLEKPHPANRILTGDVGSGKTVVAAMTALQALSAGCNTAFMAPTEILAQQHFSTFCRLPKINEFSICLLTGSKSLWRQDDQIFEIKKTELLSKLPSLAPFVIIGTHALIQKHVQLANLGLVIVDEQHRFGVFQRGRLAGHESGAPTPHFLSMTATPIPRTLALTLYGDLDVSAIAELPVGRKAVKTQMLTGQNRKTAYLEARQEIAAGRQVFVICPLIDPSDRLGVKSATEEFERLKIDEFSGLRLGLLHGQLNLQQKDTVLKSFGDRKIDILVSTTVVEVGVDFPNATVMMIEGAERFGLAQLHQLRGRVGRSALQSSCFLLTDNPNEKVLQRLRALENCHNGLQLAEIDLKLRGPGELYGNIQSGYPQFKLADVFDIQLLSAARQQAEFFLQKYSLKKFPSLAKALKRQEIIHPE